MYEKLLNANPCDNGRAWLIQQKRAGLTLSRAWEICPRPEWMLWALNVLNIRLSKEQNLRLQLQALETPIGNGQVVMDVLTDKRSLEFVDLKRRRLAGEEISEELWDTALDAALDASDNMKGAALNAAQVVAKEPRWLDTWAAIECAARTAAWSATGTKQDELWTAALSWQADRVREVVGNPF